MAYKNSVKTRRDAWRTIQAIYNKEELKVSTFVHFSNLSLQIQNSKHLDLIKEYKQKIEKELEAKCNDVLILIKDYLLVNSKNPEARVFFQKMQGDYYRYLGEFLSDKKRVIDAASDSYKHASEDAEKLKTTHPIRLGLALNYSVFYYEILN